MFLERYTIIKIIKRYNHYGANRVVHEIIEAEKLIEHTVREVENLKKEKAEAEEHYNEEMERISGAWQVIQDTCEHDFKENKCLYCEKERKT